MKYLLCLITICLTACASAQIIQYNIKGIAPKNDAYVYLSTFLEQPERKEIELFRSTKIENGKFQFEGKYDLKGELLPYAFLFIDKRADVPKQEVISKLQNMVWVPGREHNLKVIMIEDMEVSIGHPDSVILAKVTEKGYLTKESEELNTAVMEGNRKLLEIIKKYPNSPASAEAVVFFAETTIKSDAERTKAKFGSPDEMFELLSDEFRRSERGVKLKRKIDELIKSWQ